jgi:outer membrane cobalamin receptor
MSRYPANIRSAEMGVVKIDPKAVESVPVLFGEKDIIKIFQMTPGVKSAGEGNAGFYVRGGSSDQNLVLLDEAPVYNASHLLGFFSVFKTMQAKVRDLL